MEGGEARPTRDVKQSQHSEPWRDTLVRKRPAVDEQPEQSAAAARGEDQEFASRQLLGDFDHERAEEEEEDEDEEEVVEQIW